MEITTLFEHNELAFYGVRAVLLVLALLAFAAALRGWRRASQRDMQQLFARIDESRGETRALSELALQITAQLNVLRTQVDDRQLLAVASTGTAQRGYDFALQMARNGASAAELVAASGVTRHEAALLARLHNPPRH